ncbi:transcriptional regulator swi6 [Globomyces sp. JEL0801]|nr:transcriptional regulator swi6 [Globomyces sp. JEL0801]
MSDYNHANVYAHHQNQQNVAQMSAPPPKPPSDAAKKVPKNNGTNMDSMPSAVYGAVYSGVPVYEMMCRNVAVMRRQKDSFLNATQVLKVANIEKGKRTKILEKEIQNGNHEKVQGGYGKYQGTWIPFERGVQLAEQFAVDVILAPLLNYNPPNGRPDRTPTKEYVQNQARTLSGYQTKTKYHHKEKRQKVEQQVTQPHPPPAPVEHVDPFAHFHQGSQEMSFSEHYFEPQDPKSYHMYNNSPYFMDYSCNQPVQHSSIPPSPVENSSERHRSAIMALFLRSGPSSQEMLYAHSILPPDFDIDLILDDQGHTALHWAAALANTNLLTLLIQKGSKVDKLNYLGESALIRAVMMDQNYDRNSFVDTLMILKEVICIPDKKNRTVLHHICLTSSIKGRSPSCIYYMQCLLEFVAKLACDEAMSSELVHQDNGNSLAKSFFNLLDAVDVCGDTAINIAARLGNRHLFDQLAEAGADASIPNCTGLRSADFGFETQNLLSSTTAVVVNSNGANDSNKPEAEIISELQRQLCSMTRDIAQYRKEIEPLRSENATIPELKLRIQKLEESLSDNLFMSSQNQSPQLFAVQKPEVFSPSSYDEIARLRQALTHQKAIEAHLCQELVNLRGSAGQHELACKRIIATCCNVPLQHVDEILQPLLDAVQSDSFNLDMRLVSTFMSRIRQFNPNVTVPSSDSPVELSDGSYPI